MLLHVSEKIFYKIGKSLENDKTSLTESIFFKSFGKTKEFLSPLPRNSQNHSKIQNG